MGIVISVVAKFYDSDENFIKEFELSEPSEELFNLFHDPGNKNQTISGNLSSEEMEELRINYDINSNSVLEGWAEYKPKIEDARSTLKKWNVFKSRLVKSWRQYLNDSSANDVKVTNDFFWLMYTTGSILAYISVAMEQKYKVDLVFREG
jgi:hypothetical protein